MQIRPTTKSKEPIMISDERIAEIIEARRAKSNREEIALAIVNSEAFMWLMVGSNHEKMNLDILRPAYRAFCDNGGGFGNG